MAVDSARYERVQKRYHGCTRLLSSDESAGRESILQSIRRCDSVNDASAQTGLLMIKTRENRRVTRRNPVPDISGDVEFMRPSRKANATKPQMDAAPNRDPNNVETEWLWDKLRADELTAETSSQVNQPGSSNTLDDTFNSVLSTLPIATTHSVREDKANEQQPLSPTDALQPRPAGATLVVATTSRRQSSRVLEREGSSRHKFASIINQLTTNPERFEHLHALARCTSQELAAEIECLVEQFSSMVLANSCGRRETRRLATLVENPWTRSVLRDASYVRMWLFARRRFAVAPVVHRRTRSLQRATSRYETRTRHATIVPIEPPSPKLPKAQSRSRRARSSSESSASQSSSSSETDSDESDSSTERTPNHAILALGSDNGVSSCLRTPRALRRFVSHPIAVAVALPPPPTPPLSCAPRKPTRGRAPRRRADSDAVEPVESDSDDDRQRPRVATRQTRAAAHKRLAEASDSDAEGNRREDERSARASQPETPEPARGRRKASRVKRRSAADKDEEKQTTASPLPSPQPQPQPQTQPAPSSSFDETVRSCIDEVVRNVASTSTRAAKAVVKKREEPVRDAESTAPLVPPPPPVGAARRKRHPTRPPIECAPFEFVARARRNGSVGKQRPKAGSARRSELRKAVDEGRRRLANLQARWPGTGGFMLRRYATRARRPSYLRAPSVMGESRMRAGDTSKRDAFLSKFVVGSGTAWAAAGAAALRHVLEQLLEQLTEAKDSLDRRAQFGVPLEELPNRSTHPEYYWTVREPVALDTMRRRLAARYYDSFEAFDYDVLRLFANAETYAGYYTPLGELIAKLRPIYKRLKMAALEQLEVQVCTVSDVYKRRVESSELLLNARDDVDEVEVIRCACGTTHDHGVMIQCDRCFVWQHCVCLGLPDSAAADSAGDDRRYLCEVCEPRQLPTRDGIPLSFWPADGVTGCTYFYTLPVSAGQRSLELVAHLRERRLRRMPSGSDVDTDAICPFHQISLGDVVYVRLGRRCATTTGSTEPDYEPADPHEVAPLRNNCVIMKIDRMWRTPRGEEYFLGNYFVRPAERPLVAGAGPTDAHAYAANELERSARYEIHPVSNIVGLCCVLDAESATRGRPRVVNNHFDVHLDIFICDYAVNKQFRMRQKISADIQRSVNRKAFCFMTFDSHRRIERTSQPRGNAFVKTREFYCSLLAAQPAAQTSNRQQVTTNRSLVTAAKPPGVRKRGRPPLASRQPVEVVVANSESNAIADSPKRGRRRKE